MKYSGNAASALSAALADARHLVELGVPVFAGRLDGDGNPDGRDARWRGWQRTRPNVLPVDRYREGEALGAVTGSVFDVLDIDPRNGGLESLAQLNDDLGDNGPEQYWQVETASGGYHIYIAPLGLGGKNGFMPGIDLKSAGGFVFLPPTVRPSKAAANEGEPVAYRAVSALMAPLGEDRSGAALRDYITERLAARGGNGGRREALSALEQACLKAVRGEQHDALRALVAELSRTNDDDEYVVWRAWKVAQQMPNFVKHWRYTEDDVRGLLFKAGRRPIADASGEELDDLAALRDGSGPMVARAAGTSELKSLSSVEREVIRWLWYRYIAFGDATIIDSFAGIGKSLTAIDIIARATTGRPMPGQDKAKTGPINVLLLAPEDREPVLLDRVVAAGGDPARVKIPDVSLRPTRTRGKKTEMKAYLGEHLITFPESAETFHNWIKKYNIGLVVIDPIAAFLGEGIRSHEDASVRRALEPFVIILGMEKCAAWLIRHFNKDSRQSASMRGGGSVAFGAIARTHLIAGELPIDTPGSGTAGIAIVKANNVRLAKGVALAYSVEDSEIVGDDEGSAVPRIAWHGEVRVDAEELAGKPRKGPEPVAQIAWGEFLDELFADKDTWPVREVRQRAEAAGLSWDNHIYDKAMEKRGIRSEGIGRRGTERGGTDRVWTTRKPQVGRIRRPY